MKKRDVPIKIIRKLSALSMLGFVLLTSVNVLAESAINSQNETKIEDGKGRASRGLDIDQSGEVTVEDEEPTDEELLEIEMEGGASVLPEVRPYKNNGNQLSVLQSLKVSVINLKGMTVFTRKEISHLLDPIENKTVTFETLNTLRHKLSELYLNNGYVNSGVIIPDQKIENGEVTLEVIEGKLTNIEIDGLKNLDKSYIENSINNLVGNPLNVAELSEALKIVNNDNLIKKINARLLPGSHIGESTLRATVEEGPAFYYGLGIDNYVSPSVGSERILANIGHANLLGYGDKIDLQLDHTEGLNGAGISYDFPITKIGTRLGFYGSYNEHIVVEEPFDQIDIESQSYRYRFKVSHPFVKRLKQELTGSLGIEISHAESTILEQPFSFSLGAIDGESDTSVLDIAADWISRYPNKVFSINGSIRIGMPVLRATENNGNLPDGEFTLFRGTLQYAKLLSFAQSIFILRSGFQLSMDPLLSIEKYAVGGRHSVRGYRENQLVRDNAVTGSIEWILPIIKDKEKHTSLQGLIFYDTGTSWDENEKLANTETESISSVGTGLLWDPTRKLHLELFYAHALNDLIGSSDKNLQDKGIHFQITYNASH